MQFWHFNRGLEIGELDLNNITDTVASGCSTSHEPERVGWMSTIVRDRPSIVGVRNDERIRLAYLLACEFLGVPVTCLDNDFVTCHCCSIIEAVGPMRDPVIDPSHEPPERDTGIHITVCISVGGTVARRPVLEFSLRDYITDLSIQVQLPVSCGILVRQTFKADLCNPTNPLLPAGGCRPYQFKRCI